jgi:hypothetical protein
MQVQDPPNFDSHLALYQSTVRDAIAQSSELMGKLIAAARLSLQIRASGATEFRERDSVEESLRQLKVKESELRSLYPKVLRVAFADPEAGRKSAPLAPAGALQFDQLELMDESQVQESITMARAQQAAMLLVEGSLAELNTLICSTLGLKTVRPDRNPLRPEVYVKALKDVVEQIQVQHSVRMDWLAAMSMALGKELRELYDSVAATLQSQGVQAAGYAVIQAPNAPVGVGTGGVASSSSGQGGAETANAGPGSASAGMPSAPLRPRPKARSDALLTLDKLRGLLAGELDSMTESPKNQRLAGFAAQFAQDFESESGPLSQPHSDFDATIPAAFEALSEMKQADQVVRKLEERRAIDVPLPASNDGTVAAVRDQLRRNARGVAQALSLEVVTLMIENMARDPRLLEPVQQLVKKLEPALLRLALLDPRFFTDKQHPARMLLQEITHRSLAYSSVQATGFAEFLNELDQAVTPLSIAPIPNAEPFVIVLTQLRQAWDKVAKERDLARENAVRVLQIAEQRNLLAEKIAREIDSHPDASKVPAVVIDFLCGPWAQVVAQARMAGVGGSAAADKYQALISAMLWSAHPDLPRKNIAKLTRLVPLLIDTLRDGLQSIHYPPVKTSAFLEALMALHQLAFKSVQKSTSDVAPAAPAPATPAPQAAMRSHLLAEGNPWVAPQEAQASNFMDMPLDAEAPSEEGGTGAAVEGTLAQELPLGAWLELLVSGQWVRTQLTWVSPHRTLFLFTSVFGTTQSMTRRSLDKLATAGNLRVISGQPLVDGALDAVANIAMRNSIDVTL